jgi:hypothetical protein
MRLKFLYHQKEAPSAGGVKGLCVDGGGRLTAGRATFGCGGGAATDAAAVPAALLDAALALGDHGVEMLAGDVITSSAGGAR